MEFISVDFALGEAENNGKKSCNHSLFYNSLTETSQVKVSHTPETGISLPLCAYSSLILKDSSVLKIIGTKLFPLFRLPVRYVYQPCGQAYISETSKLHLIHHQGLFPKHWSWRPEVSPWQLQPVDVSLRCQHKDRGLPSALQWKESSQALVFSEILGHCLLIPRQWRNNEFLTPTCIAVPEQMLIELTKIQKNDLADNETHYVWNPIIPPITAHSFFPKVSCILR